MKLEGLSVFGISSNWDEFELWPSESCAIELQGIMVAIYIVLINSRERVNIENTHAVMIIVMSL